MWQFKKMDHNLSYRGLIWVIQRPNIKFLDAATISMKGTSPISLFFPTKTVPKSGIVCRVKTGQPMAVPKNGPKLKL